MTLGSLPLLALIGPDLALQAGYPGQTGFGVAQWGYTYFSFLSGFTLGPSMRDLHTLSAVDAARQSLPWLAVLGLVAGPLAYRGLSRLRGEGERGQAPFAGTARRVLRTNGACPLSPDRQLADWLVLLIAP